MTIGKAGSTNWGCCTGPNCTNYNSRCSLNMCGLCCAKIHSSLVVPCSKPWAAGTQEHSSLPAVYKPAPPPEPNPETLVELLEDAEPGDWTLGEKVVSYTTYYTAGG